MKRQLMVLALLWWSAACKNDSALSSASPFEQAPAAETKAVNAAPAQPAAAPKPDNAVEPAPEVAHTASFQTSRGRSIQWKRNAALEADLMQALELTQDELCQEVGSQSCIRAVHTVALGGNDPFGSGLLRPATSSLSTTPLAVDRVTLSACSRRARADKEGTPKVFTALDLSGRAPAAGSEATTATVTTLYRRLLARDPKPNEIAIIEGLLGEPMTAEAFATLSCFVVASSLEFLFF